MKTFPVGSTQKQIMSALREWQDKKAPQRRGLSSAITTVPHVQPRSKGSNLGCVTRVTDRDPPGLRDGPGQPVQHGQGLSARRCRSHRQTEVLWDTSAIKMNQNEALLCLMSRSVLSSVTLGAGPGLTAARPRSHRRRPLLGSRLCRLRCRSVPALRPSSARPRLPGLPCRSQPSVTQHPSPEPPPHALPAGTGPGPRCPGAKGGLGPGEAPRGGSRARQALSRAEPREPAPHSPLL